GRRHYQPGIWRNGPGAGHLPRGRGPARGKINAVSEVDAGSTFTLLLPRSLPDLAGDTPAKPVATGSQPAGHTGGQHGPARAAPAGSAPIETPTAASQPHHALRGRKILIIDDAVRNVFAITSILELYGLSVVHAPDGRKGIDILLAGHDIDLVLVDVMMPDMD